jgi:hypothetical protein
MIGIWLEIDISVSLKINGQVIFLLFDDDWGLLIVAVEYNVSLIIWVLDEVFCLFTFYPGYTSLLC